MEKRKIFIIDDDSTFLKLLKVLFEKENYTVIINRNYSNICLKIKESNPEDDAPSMMSGQPAGDTGEAAREWKL